MHFPAFKTMQEKKENLDSSFIFLRYQSAKGKVKSVTQTRSKDINKEFYTPNW